MGGASVAPEPSAGAAAKEGSRKSVVAKLERANTRFSISGAMDAVKYVNTQSKNLAPWYILHPHSSGVALWDLTTSIALIFTALVTPFEVSFLDSVTPAGPWTLFTLNRLIDVIFIVDMALQFVIMQQVDFKKGIDTDSLWEHRISRLARRYLRMWFWIDLASVIPSVFDILPAVQSSDDASGAGRVKVLRVVRTLRLAKLVRLFRTSRVIERWETRLAIPYNLLTLIQLFVGIVYATHIFACILTLQTTFASRPLSWIGAFGYCDALATNATTSAGVVCAGPWELYLQAFYWALGLVLSFTNEPLRGLHESYPNERRTTDLLHSEQVVVLVLHFMGALLWAYVTARLVDVIVNASPEVTRFRQNSEAVAASAQRPPAPPAAPPPLLIVPASDSAARSAHTPT